MSSLLFFRVIISQVTTPSSPRARNQKAQVLFARRLSLTQLNHIIPATPFLWRCWAEISLLVSAHNILEPVIWHQLNKWLVFTRERLEGHAQCALHNSRCNFYTSCPQCLFFFEDHSEKNSRVLVWRSRQKSSHAVRPLACPLAAPTMWNSSAVSVNS